MTTTTLILNPDSGNQALEAQLQPKPARVNPSKVRLAIVMILAVYPLITMLLYILAPLTEGWAVWHRTILIAPIMVLSIVFVVSPAIQKYLGWFVARMPSPTK
ncbi:hypothetical protein [Neorhizobium galegae]|uniref:hypothetical protein n=1 Tax=Neorhizobium galegae TaxID=399 RepID=UPI0020C77E97|nr:hypothetical protein [Neorhizobium galegae]